MEDEKLEEEEWGEEEEKERGEEEEDEEKEVVEEEEAVEKEKETEEEEQVRRGLQHCLAAARPALVVSSLFLSQAPAPCPLTEEVLKEGLSLLCKTSNGLAHAYVKFEAKSK